jgi:ectoine hydroxylase-related dioxygenase (phytanoyl-CoA dioxygenase family)
MTLRASLHRLDRRLGYPLTAIVEKRREQLRMVDFERDRKLRQQRYPIPRPPSSETRTVLSQLNRDGFAVMRQAVSRERILGVREQLEKRLDSGEDLLPVSDDAARKAGDREAASKFLTAAELNKGQDYLRAHTNYAAVAEPLLSCPLTIPLSFEQQLIDIATAYLECVPAIGGLNLRKSFRNDLPEFDTLYFHVDPNSPKFLKFFFYLNDVDEAGGPFCYVRGSHRRRFPGWQTKYRWELEEIAPRYGEENVLLLTGNVGDIVIADTNGFHRGTKIRGQDRGMLTVDYVVHQEFGGSQAQFSIRRKDLDALTPAQRPAADFLKVV